MFFLSDVFQTGFCTDYCGWHDNNGNIKYGWIGIPPKGCACFSQKNLPMAILRLILLSVSLLMNSWKQQQIHWALHGTIPMVMKMAMFVPGALSTAYTVKATTTTW
jgi:hypothetical protein